MNPCSFSTFFRKSTPSLISFPFFFSSGNTVSGWKWWWMIASRQRMDTWYLYTQQRGMNSGDHCWKRPTPSKSRQSTHALCRKLYFLSLKSMYHCWPPSENASWPAVYWLQFFYVTWNKYADWKSHMMARQLAFSDGSVCFLWEVPLFYY